jgi:hypothetical protein
MGASCIIFRTLIAIASMLCVGLLVVDCAQAVEKKGASKETIYVLLEDGRVGTFDISTGRFVAVANVSYINGGEPFGPTEIAVCRNDLMYIFGDAGAVHRIIELNLKTRKKKLLTGAEYGWIQMMACDARGMLIANYYGAGRITLINTKKNGEVVSLPDYDDEQYFYYGALTLDEKYVMIGDNDKIYYIDRRRNKLVKQRQVDHWGFDGLVKIGRYFYVFVEQSVTRIDSGTLKVSLLWDFDGSLAVPDFLSAAVAP